MQTSDAYREADTRNPLVPGLGFNIAKWRTLEFRKIVDFRGNLTAIEGGVDIAFDIARVYYIFDIPSGSTRAGHAHKELRQIYLPLSGSFDVFLEDDSQSETVRLSRPNVGLYIGPGVWREITNFSTGAVCVVLASAHFDESDYLRTYEGFRSYLDHAG